MSDVKEAAVGPMLALPVKLEKETIDAISRWGTEMLAYGKQQALAELRCGACKEFGECGMAAYYRDYYVSFGDSDEYGCILWEGKE